VIQLLPSRQEALASSPALQKEKFSRLKKKKRKKERKKRKTSQAPVACNPSRDQEEQGSRPAQKIVGETLF
jgi:hypothetical protein